VACARRRVAPRRVAQCRDRPRWNARALRELLGFSKGRERSGGTARCDGFQEAQTFWKIKEKGDGEDARGEDAAA
jgi:hypothetical protein